MRFLDLVGLILYNLNRRKGRVGLTAIGVIIGTAAVVVLVSLAVGLQKNATSQLYGISDLTNIEVYPGYNMEGGPGSRHGAESRAAEAAAVEVRTLASNYSRRRRLKTSKPSRG